MDNGTFGLGGELAKEVAFAFMFCYYFEQVYFVMFNGLPVFLFVKLLYYTTCFLKNCTHFFFFFVFCLVCSLKN